MLLIFKLNLQVQYYVSINHEQEGILMENEQALVQCDKVREQIIHYFLSCLKGGYLVWFTLRGTYFILKREEKDARMYMKPGQNNVQVK